MPVVGTGFLPVANQGSANYINIVRRNFIRSLIYQNLRHAKPFLRYLIENCSRPRSGGFSPITQPVMLTTFANNGAYSGWGGNFTIPGIDNPAVNAEWNQALYIMPIVFTQPELSLMEGAGSNELTVIDIIQARLYDNYQSVLDTMSAAFLGTGFANPLAFLGIRDAVDNGTNNPTYGNIVRAANPGWNAMAYANTQGANPAYQQILYYLLSFLQDTNAPLPTLGLVSYSVYYSLITSFTNIETMVVQDVSNIAKDREYKIQALDIGGVPHVVDPNLAGTTGYYLNMNHMFYDYNEDFNFKITEPESLIPVGQLAFVQPMTVAGQFYSDLPSSHFSLTGMPSTVLA